MRPNAFLIIYPLSVLGLVVTGFKRLQFKVYIPHPICRVKKFGDRGRAYTLRLIAAVIISGDAAFPCCARHVAVCL